MLMKIGDITSRFGISHRSLHYWEDMGIIKSSRAENDYRYYDEENQQKIRQILILRKLRIPLKQIFEYDRSRSYRDDTSDDHKVRCSGWGCLEEHFNSYNLYGLQNKSIYFHILTF